MIDLERALRLALDAGDPYAGRGLDAWKALEDQHKATREATGI